jgi:hypothetical protein
LKAIKDSQLVIYHLNPLLYRRLMLEKRGLSPNLLASTIFHPTRVVTAHVEYVSLGNKLFDHLQPDSDRAGGAGHSGRSRADTLAW